MSRLNYLPVNWVDGMKISKNNFIDSENALFDRLNLSASINLNPFKYGLLPIEPGKEDSLNFSADIDDQKILHIRLSRCNAITKGGIIIDIDSFDDRGKSEDIFAIKESVDLRELEDGQYAIILSINPFKRVPVGSSDPDERPPRNPFVIPEYTINVVNFQNININDIGNHFLTIGILNLDVENTVIERDFIPPCTSTSSHPNLVLFHNHLNEFWSKLERDIVSIIGKIHIKRQQSTLSSSVHSISLTILNFLSNNIVFHRWYYIHQHPVNMIAMIISLARLLRNSIEVMSHQQKEELINYFTDWCNLRTGEFEDMLYKAINLNFEQENINHTINEISKFLEVLDLLFTTLSGLDYIGKRKQTGIFVKEERSQRNLNNEQSDYSSNHEVKRSSFLADD